MDEDLVFDPSASTFTASKVCMKLPQHRLFLGTDLDDFCSEFSKHSIIETYARQLLSAERDIKSSDTSLMKSAEVAYLEL